MKERMKKLVALMLCAGMAVSSLIGCSDSGETEKSTSAANSDENVEENPNNEEITELDIFINMSWWPVDYWKGIIPETITEKTGVKLNITVAADEQQLGLMIASGELPDLVFTDSETTRLSDDSICYAYDELAEEYGIEFEVDSLRESIGKSLSGTEHYYTILNAMSLTEEVEESIIVPGQACIYYRKDLYEAMESPKLENLDDFLNVCEQVQEEYPEMIPCLLDEAWKLQAISSWIGAGYASHTYGNQYVPTEDGGAVYYISDPEYKDFLKYANTLARKGYITAEAYANDGTIDVQQMAINGECFFYCYYLDPASLQTIDNQAKDVNPDAEWAVVPALGNYGVADTNKGWAGLFISKNCKNPEKAMEFVAYMYSDEGSHLSKWGREGIEYTLDEDGTPVFSEEFLALQSDTEALNEQYNMYCYYGVKGVDENAAKYAAMDEEDYAGFVTYKEGYTNDPAIGIAIPTASSDEGLIQAKLKEMLESEEAKVIFASSDEEFEVNYENLMNLANQIGLDTLNDYMNTRIPEVREEFGL